MVVGFLEGKDDRAWNYFSSDTPTEKQLAGLAILLEPYWDKIIDLFKEQNFKEKEKELKEFAHKVSEKQWERILKNKIKMD